jgi:sphingomyelin phosphodiesterase acid-like 3
MNIIQKFCKYLVVFIPLTCFAAAKTNLNFLVMSDIHLNTHAKHQMQLAPKTNTIRNDLDLITYLSFLKLSKKNINSGFVNKPNFILLLGDLQGHKRYKNDVTTSEASVLKTIYETFTNTPVIYIFGNNDSPQKNYGKFSYNNISPFTIAKNNANWKNGFLSTGNICKNKLIYPCIQSQNKKNGYFVIKLAPNLQLIGLNSVLFSIHNKFEHDAKNEIFWFAKQLDISKQRHEQTLIAMHIPPGYNIYNNQQFWRENEYKQFIEITNKYSDIIIGMLTAHTHQEEMKILTTKSSKLGAYSTPALSTAYGNAPIIKTFLISEMSKKWHINNYITYKFVSQNNILALTKIYDFQNFYCKVQTHDINFCLRKVNISKAKKYMSGDNHNHQSLVRAPNKIYLS